MNFNESEPAFLIAIEDPTLQEYAQKYPYANGSDSILNQKLREAIRSHFTTRQPRKTTFEYRLVDYRLADSLSEEDRQRIVNTAVFCGLPPFQARGLANYFGWKVAHIPRSAQSILSIGCANGHELIVIRSLFPDTKISAVDYSLDIPEEWISKLRLSEVMSEPIDAYLSKHFHEFDAVFSNHVLEHLFNPEWTLKLIHNACILGGVVVSALPLEAVSANIFYKDVINFTLTNSTKDNLALSLSYLNAGHAWKTNLLDLTATFSEAGYSNIFVTSSATHPTGLPGYNPIDISECNSSLQQANLVNQLLLKPLRKILSLPFRDNIPEFIIKLYYALDSRLPVGNCRAVSKVPEVLIKATVS